MRINEYFNNADFSESTHNLTGSDLLSLQSSDLVFICQDSDETVNLKTWEQIGDVNQTAPVILYCNQIKYYELIKVLKEGALGILLKNQPVQEFIKCINDVLEGQRYICYEALVMIAEHAIGGKDILTKALNTREKVVAAYLKEGHGTNYIAKQLNISLSAVSIAKHKIFEKLRIENILQLREMMNSGMLQ